MYRTPRVPHKYDTHDTTSLRTCLAVRRSIYLASLWAPNSVCALLMSWFIFFFFQAEDGIRDVAVTGVQTCALPICPRLVDRPDRPDEGVLDQVGRVELAPQPGVQVGPGEDPQVRPEPLQGLRLVEIGRASCRERV